MSGHLLRSRGFSFGEFAPGIGEGNYLILGGETRPRGFAFAQDQDVLKLYLGTTEGLQVWDGRQYSTKIADIPIPDCLVVGDVLVIEDGDLIVSCVEERTLVRLDPQSGEVQQVFDCCGDLDGFEPFALAMGPTGTVFAGRNGIYEFDPEDGTLVREAIPAGILDAASYYDIVFAPDGALLVSAPDVGVLRFRPPDWEFTDLLVPADEASVPAPGPLAITPEGNLLVSNSTLGGLLREFDTSTGEFIREWFADDGGFSVVAIGFRP